MRRPPRRCASDAIPVARDRPGPAPRARRAGRRCLAASTRSRIRSTPSSQAPALRASGRRSIGLRVRGRVDRPTARRPADASIRSAQPARPRRRDRQLVGDAADAGPSAARRATTSIATERQARRRPAASAPPSSSSAVERFGQFDLHHFVESLRCRPPGPRETSSAAWDETPRSSQRQVRRGETAVPHARTRSRWPIQRRSPCFAKANAYSLSNHRCSICRTADVPQPNDVVERRSVFDDAAATRHHVVHPPTPAEPSSTPPCK